MVENTLDTLFSEDLIPYSVALVLALILIVLAAINEPPPGRTPVWAYAVIGLVLTFGCGSIFNALVTSIQDPQQSGIVLFAVVGIILIALVTALVKFIFRNK